MARDSRMVVRSDARAMGAVTAHSPRVSAPWSSLRTTVRGFAETDEGRALADEGIASVKVTRIVDGIEVTETRSVHSFRKGRTSTSRIPRSAPVARVSDCQRFADTIGYVGNGESD